MFFEVFFSSETAALKNYRHAVWFQATTKRSIFCQYSCWVYITSCLFNNYGWNARFTLYGVEYSQLSALPMRHGQLDIIKRPFIRIYRIRSEARQYLCASEWQVWNIYPPPTLPHSPPLSSCERSVWVSYLSDDERIQARHSCPGECGPSKWWTKTHKWTFQHWAAKSTWHEECYSSDPVPQRQLLFHNSIDRLFVYVTLRRSEFLPKKTSPRCSFRLSMKTHLIIFACCFISLVRNQNTVSRQNWSTWAAWSSPSGHSLYDDLRPTASQLTGLC